MILILFLKIVSLIPLRILHFVSTILAYIFYYTGFYRKKIVLQNLKLAFPEKKDSEINNICKKFYFHLFDVIIEGIKFYSISHKEIEKRFKFINDNIVFSNPNKNIFVLTAHYSNWEWFPYFSYKTNFWEKIKGWAVYLKVKNNKIDKYIRKNRERFNLNMIEKYSLLRTIVKNSSSDYKNVYGILIDQSPHILEVNGFVDFLGLKTPVDFTLDKLIQKLDIAVFFVDIEKLKRGYYQCKFIKITDNAKKENQEYVTKEYFRLLEKKIISNPEYWLWTHRRWKHKDVNI